MVLYSILRVFATQIVKWVFSTNSSTSKLAKILIALSLMVAACGESVTEGPTAEPTAGVETPSGGVEDPWGVITYVPNEAILIGVAGPFTGDRASLADAIWRGAEIAVGEKPDIAGFPIEIFKIDDAANPSQAASDAVGNPRLSAVVGHAFSSATREVIPIYEGAGIIMVSPRANSPDLTDPGSPVFNRVAVNWAYQGGVAADYLFNSLGLTSLAIVYADYEDNYFERGIANFAQSRFESLGGRVEFFQGITPETQDFTDLLNTLEGISPEAIFLVGLASGEGATIFLNQMLDLGLLAETYLLASDEAEFSESFLNTARQVRDVRAGTVAISRMEQLQDSEELNNFVNTYSVNLVGDERFVPHGYDATMFILDAIEKIAVLGEGGELRLGRKALADAVRSTLEFPGVTGFLTCNQFGDCPAADVNFLVPNDVGWVLAPEGIREPGVTLNQIITARDFLSLDLIDLESAGGHPTASGQLYQLLGAAAFDPQQDGFIGILFIGELSESPYPPGLYKVLLVDESLENPRLLLVDQDQNQIEAIGVMVVGHAALNLLEGQRAFLVENSHRRCSLCIIKCVCWNC